MKNTLFLCFQLFDIVLVAYIFYRVYWLIENTRALNMLRGLIILFIATFAAQILHLFLLSWLLRSLWTVWLIASVVVFQPEIRSALAEMGRSTFSTLKFRLGILDKILGAVVAFSEKKIGAMLVFERNEGLKNYIEAGMEMDAKVSKELLETIFSPNGPLHDGGVILKQEKIAAAACFFPLTKRMDLPKSVGTRHRAAIGLTEVSDALVIVVSEETGGISLVENGEIVWNANHENLKDVLTKYYYKGKNKKSFIRSVIEGDVFKRNIGMKFTCLALAGILWYYVKYLLVNY